MLTIELCANPQLISFDTRSALNSLVPEDGSAFEMLNEIIQYEPKELFGAEQLGTNRKVTAWEIRMKMNT